MTVDLKKKYRDCYQPGREPELIELREAHYIAVRGKGDPNDPEGDYQRTLGILYAVAYTLRMSRRNGYDIPDYYEYIVPPLEGFWWQEGVRGMDYAHKEELCWISVLRLPEFVTREAFDWAVGEASRKKKIDCSRAEFLSLEEGLCVQAMHIGPYDTEPETVARMDAWLADNGYEDDFSPERLHHEIYLSDPRRTPPEKRRTVIRHPIRRK